MANKNRSLVAERNLWCSRLDFVIRRDVAGICPFYLRPQTATIKKGAWRLPSGRQSCLKCQASQARTGHEIPRSVDRAMIQTVFEEILRRMA